MSAHTAVQVTRKGFDHGASPAEAFLFSVDGFADIPAELHQFRIRGPQRLVLAATDTSLELNSLSGAGRKKLLGS